MCFCTISHRAEPLYQRSYSLQSVKLYLASYLQKKQKERKLADSWCCHTTILEARYFVLLEKAKGEGKEESKDKWIFKTKRSGVMVRGRQSSERKRFISL